MAEPNQVPIDKIHLVPLVQRRKGGEKGTETKVMGEIDGGGNGRTTVA